MLVIWDLGPVFYINGVSLILIYFAWMLWQPILDEGQPHLVETFWNKYPFEESIKLILPNDSSNELFLLPENRMSNRCYSSLIELYIVDSVVVHGLLLLFHS